MAILYDVIFIVFAVLYFPYLIVRKKWHAGFSMRWGVFPRVLREALDSKSNIWIHAVSVGEVLAVAGLIKSIKDTFPFYQIIISTVTTTGYQVAKKTFADDIVIYAPFDLSWVVRRYIRMINPKIYLAAETEIWPNLFWALYKRGIPIIQVNGRISNKAYAGYKIIKPFLQKIIQCVEVFCMQSDSDSQKIKELGAPADRVHTLGNIKFDDILSSETRDEAKFVLDNKARVIVAGSTHPGEEEILLDIFKTLKKEFPTLRLIIAPRHIERSDEIIGLIKQMGFLAEKFSQLNHSLDGDCIIVVDSVGHLKSLYGLATLVFVGKSLKVGGGQNIIEPASFAKPVFVGPHMENFRDIVGIFLKEEAIIQVKDASQLLSKMKQFLRSPVEREKIGRRAKDVVEKNTGATARTMNIITTIMVNAK